MNSENQRKIIGFGILFFIFVFMMSIGLMLNNIKTAAALSETKTALIDSVNNTTSEITSAITEISDKIDTVIENETSILETITVDPCVVSCSEDYNVTVSENVTQRFAIGEEVLLPALSTEPKLFTDYRHYNLWYTPHYRLQQAAYTDENGLRRFNEDYIVGLGKFYSESIGDRFQITLDTGIEFTIILGDGKAPCDCDENNMYTPCVNYANEDCANVLEFIVDDNAMSPKVYAYGSIDYLDKFKGDIVKMVYLGRDNSDDWDLYESR